MDRETLRGERFDGPPNFWGPLATAREGQTEAYQEGALDCSESGPTNPGQGTRRVQYFNKARIELIHPA